MISWNDQFVKGNNECAEQVKLAVQDGLQAYCLDLRWKQRSATFTKEKADEEAIRVFAENARQLLLAAPMGQKRVLAIDPGFRTGCKVVCLDEQGKLLKNTPPSYPHTGAGQAKRSRKDCTEF